MKKFLLLLIFVSTYSITQAQVPSSCSVSSLLANEYNRDIKQLATKRLFQLQSSDTALVRIPQVHIDTISEGLAAIFNATTIPERDSVFNLYCVHNSNGWPGDYAGFLVQVDTSYPWTNAWQNVITITGDPLMDTILTRYNLTITNFYNWTIGTYAVLSTDSTWNSFALIDSFLMVTGVLAAERNAFIGAAGKIEYNKIGNVRYYDFTFEFNDCFDGCDNTHTWMFSVHDDCSVDYLGFSDWGFFGIQPLPAPLNCNTFTSVAENNRQKVNCLIFPNPSNGKFQFEVNGLDFEKNSTCIVYNMTGETIHQSTITNKKFDIDLSDQTNGIYFVQINNGQSILTNKIVIQ